MFDYSDTFVDSLDSGTPEENESNELHIHAGDVDPTRTITEQIIDVTLDALQLQLELNCQTLDLIISWTVSSINICGQNVGKMQRFLLHSVGYRDAKKYIICLDESHRCHFGLMSSKDDLCPHCNKKGTIP
ncbi:hypothetical protein pdam_00025430 [Pocillopora damicornis]|uniref:Uncharacterized protein n=1 Tax=Pocillopora damicornis TaxID=46731 RepID=A0A3M6UD26_POCDA|nr:hypothetical protein pdam_00025430 [Pocillopora damicornis]